MKICANLFVIFLLLSASSSHKALAHGSQSQGSVSALGNNVTTATPQASTWNDKSQRNVDDRQLNKFAGELTKIDLKKEEALTQLDALASRVEAYHKVLFTRNYNAMDILKDTEALQKRINDRRAKFSRPRKAAVNNVAVPMASQASSAAIAPAPAAMTPTNLTDHPLPANTVVAPATSSTSPTAVPLLQGTHN